jgi:hypothetical protein
VFDAINGRYHVPGTAQVAEHASCEQAVAAAAQQRLPSWQHGAAVHTWVDNCDDRKHVNKCFKQSKFDRKHASRKMICPLAVHPTVYHVPHLLHLSVIPSNKSVRQV